LTDTRSKLANGTLPDQSAGKVTLAAFADHFMATSTHLRPKSREVYEAWLRVHILPALGERKLSDISRAEIRRFEASLVADGRGVATIGGVHRLLHRMFAVAIDEERVSRNPVQGVRVERARQREARFLDVDEIGRIGVEVPDRYRVLVYALGFSGIRIGEAAALRMRSLDLRTGTIRVTENSVEVSGARCSGRRRRLGPYEPLTSALVSLRC
jgi:integrase